MNLEDKLKNICAEIHVDASIEAEEMIKVVRQNFLKNSGTLPQDIVDHILDLARGAFELGAEYGVMAYIRRKKGL